VHKIQDPSRKMIIGLKRKFPTLILIDSSKVMCDNKTCFSEIKKIPIYFDNMRNVGVQNNGHLTAAASTKIAHLYLKKYPNPF